MSAESTLRAYLRRCREQSGRSVEAVASGSRMAPQFIGALAQVVHATIPDEPRP